MAIAAANGTVQRKSTTSGRGYSDSCSRLSEMSLLSTPVQAPSPIETSVPIPAAKRPGMSRTGSLLPPMPVASIRITAAMIGEPNSRRRPRTSRRR